MLIRLLQQFSTFELAQEANPESIPPPGWAKSKGSDGKDQVLIKAHLTMYVKVSSLPCTSYHNDHSNLSFPWSVFL